MMRDDTFHQFSCQSIGGLSAMHASERRKAARSDRSGLFAASIFPHSHLWQPSHGYIARLHGI